MVQKKDYLTKEGLAKLEAELEHLHNVRRQDVANRIQKAKEIGGTADNAEYDEAKNEQAFVEGRILTLENIINNAAIISDVQASHKIVGVGSRVTLEDQKGALVHYFIVGSTEADPSQGRISNQSPVGKALLGRRAGERVEVKVPAGANRLKIIAIE